MHPENTPLGVKLHTKFPKDSECFSEVVKVFQVRLTLDGHVVNIDFHLFAYEALKDLIEEMLASCIRVFQFEQHDFVAIESLVGYEGSFLLDFWM